MAVGADLVMNTQQPLSSWDRFAAVAPAENLIQAGGSRCMVVADAADAVRPMLWAMAAGGALVRQGNAVAW